MYVNLDDNEFDNFAKGNGGWSDRKRERITKALLTGGEAEMNGMRALRKMCKEQLATARFSSRKEKIKALKMCIMEARERLLGGTLD